MSKYIKKHGSVIIKGNTWDGRDGSNGIIIEGWHVENADAGYLKGYALWFALKSILKAWLNFVIYRK